jgi:methionyl-tRNA synthetase
MKQEILKQQIKNYFQYMFEKNQSNQMSDQEFQNQIKNYSNNSFLEIDEVLENIKFKDLNIHEFSISEVENAYFDATDELLKENQQQN